MHLTSYTDYSLRLLIFLGSKNEGELSNIKEISDVYRISKNHLSKIVYDLGKLGIIKTVRGRNGGIALAMKPSEINLGMIVRELEEDMDVAVCFNERKNDCLITPVCKLKHVLNEALNSFLHVLDQYTLEDVILRRDVLDTVLGTEKQT